MTFIDLCAGIGGFSLGLERAGLTCIGQVENDDFCNRILARHWPDVPRWGDITTLAPDCLPATDLVVGGYPCQPFSLAGQRRGTADDRHLWPYVRGIVAHLRPAWCLFENVAGHITLGLDTVLAEMEALGYACGPLVIPACAVDAPHRRDRVWILAHTEHGGQDSRSKQAGRQAWSEADRLPDGTGTVLAHAEIGNVGAGLCASNTPGERREPRWQWRRSGDGGGQGGEVHSHTDSFAGSEKRNAPPFADRQGQPGGLPVAEWGDWQKWEPEPGVGRVAHGVPRRVDRLHSLGNAVVPQLVEVIGRAMLASEDEQALVCLI